MGLSRAEYVFPEYEGMQPGHPACQGCGAALGLRYAAQALGPKAVLVVVAGCSTTIAGVHPTSALKIPVLHTAFATGGAAASGLSAALAARGITDVPVVVWAGDGGTFDIGLQALSGAVERNDSFLFLCADNEAYMNTGVQRSGATPYGAWTTTTPVAAPETRHKKDIMSIMAAHRIPYAATATIAFPEDLLNKIRAALATPGSKFIHILAPCPSGWKYDSDLSIKLSRLAVETRAFPLYEITDGTHYRVTVNPERKREPSEYLALQGRFSHLTGEDLKCIEDEIEFNWKTLQLRCEMSARMGR